MGTRQGLTSIRAENDFALQRYLAILAKQIPNIDR
jgi:hypothetical protein